MNVSTELSVRPVLTSRYVDFTTGKALNFTPPSSSDRLAALQNYLKIIEQYEEITQPGWWNFPAAKDIPEDLFLGFTDLIAKYNLSAAVPQIFSTTGFGVHDLLENLTLWVMRAFGPDIARAILGMSSSFVPKSHKNQDLYNNILSLLGEDVLLSSVVTSSSRSQSGVVLQVKSHDGSLTEVHAKRLLISIEPTEENMRSLDPDDEEHKVFTAFNYSKTYVGVVSHPSLPPNVSLVNMPATAQPANWAQVIPSPPYNARFDHFGDASSFFRVIMVGNESFTATEAKLLVEQSFNNMMSTRVLNESSVEQLQWRAFEAHGLVSAHYSAESLKEGMIQRLNGLQGRRSTWYTGSAWSVHLSTSLWQFTDTVLPKLLASLHESSETIAGNDMT
jgi:hypothetical protein